MLALQLGFAEDSGWRYSMESSQWCPSDDVEGSQALDLSAGMASLRINFRVWFPQTWHTGIQEDNRSRLVIKRKHTGRNLSSFQEAGLRSSQ